MMHRADKTGKGNAVEVHGKFRNLADVQAVNRTRRNGEFFAGHRAYIEDVLRYIIGYSILGFQGMFYGDVLKVEFAGEGKIHMMIFL